MAELQVPTLDLSALGELPDIYRKAKQQSFREQTLATLGQNGADPSSLVNKFVAAGDLDTAAKLTALGKVDTTDELKEYKFDMAQRKAAGQPDLNFGDWKTALKRAGATRVNTNVNTGEKSYDTALGKEYADSFINTQKAGRNAVGEKATLDTLEKLTNDPNFYSGSGAEKFALPLKQIVSRLGGDPNAAAPMETFRALSNKAVLDTMGGSLGSGFSNADRDFVVGQVANLSNTPEGNRQLIDIRRKVANRSQEIAKLARDYAREKGGRIDAGFDQRLADYAEKNPLFDSKPKGGAARLKFNPATGNLE